MSKARELASLGNAYSDGALSNRNLIINGAMTIDQRNGGSSVTPTTSTYTLDRWLAIASLTSKFSVQQNAGSVTPPNGFSNYLGATSLSAYSVGTTETFALSQRIEGFNAAILNWGTAAAKPITVSVWVRSSLTGTFGGALRNSANDRSYPFTYTISAANTWEYKTITIAGDTTGTWLTNNGSGLEITFGLGSGSTRSGTAGSWAGTNYTNATGATSIVATSGATFYLTGVQLEVGDTATPFEHRSYGQELALCQRYLYRMDAGLALINGGSPNYSDSLFDVYFPVTMRSAPTMLSTGITGYGAGSTQYRIYILNSAGGGFLGAPASTVFYSSYATKNKVRVVAGHAAGWFNSTIDTGGAALDVGSDVKLMWEAEL